MKFYGIEAKGDVIIEKVSTLPVWASSDEGRIVYAEDANRLYLGTDTTWVDITSNSIANGGTGATNASDARDNLGVSPAFVSGTIMLFAQTSAPTGWTKKTDWADNSMIVYTTGSVSGGGSVDAKLAHQHSAFTITIAEMPAHDHTGSFYVGGGVNQDAGVAGDDSTKTATVPSQGGGGSHQHAANTSPYYRKVIAAVKD